MLCKTKRLSRKPFKLEKWVRVPYRVPPSVFWQSGKTLDSRTDCNISLWLNWLAHSTYNWGVLGSIPSRETIYFGKNRHSIWSHKSDSVSSTLTPEPICAIGVQWSAYRSSKPRVRVQVPYSTPNVQVMELAYIQVLEIWFYGFDSRLGHHFSYSSALYFLSRRWVSWLAVERKRRAKVRDAKSSNIRVFSSIW